jgi:hypothetical protein
MRDHDVLEMFEVRATIKQRTDVLGLIGADTRLKKVASNGGGEYAGPLPVLWRA